MFSFPSWFKMAPRVEGNCIKIPGAAPVVPGEMAPVIARNPENL